MPMMSIELSLAASRRTSCWRWASAWVGSVLIWIEYLPPDACVQTLAACGERARRLREHVPAAAPAARSTRRRPPGPSAPRLPPGHSATTRPIAQLARPALSPHDSSTYPPEPNVTNLSTGNSQLQPRGSVPTAGWSSDGPRGRPSRRARGITLRSPPSPGAGLELELRSAAGPGCGSSDRLTAIT